MRNLDEKSLVKTGHIIPFIFVLAVIPLLTMMGTYKSGIGENAWASGNSFYDMFLLFKSRFLISVGAVVTVFLIIFFTSGKVKKEDLKLEWCPLIFVGIFFVFSFISSLMAEEQGDALFGGYEQMEGLFVVLSYVSCFCFIAFFCDIKNWVEMLLRALIIGSLIISLLGALQAVGIDYLTNEAVFPFFTMLAKMPDNVRHLTASFGKGVSYATLYNPNYVGTYVALVLPITVLLAVTEKKRIFRIMAAASSILQIVMLVGAKSMAGLIGVAGAALVAYIFLWADARKNRFIICGVGAVVLCLAAGVLLFVPGVLSRFTDSTISRCSYRIASMVTPSGSLDPMKIKLDSGRTLSLKWKQGETIFDFDVYDENGDAVALTGSAFEGAGFKGEDWNGLKLSAEKRDFVVDGKEETFDTLRLTVDEKYYWDFVRFGDAIRYINRAGKLDHISEIDHEGFEGNYDLATNRGYIWSRTLPLMKETAFVGIGQDNFVYAFPNDDYVGKVNCGFDGQLITKPHNMYMQIWVQAGLPACAAFVGLFLVFAFRTVRRTFKKGKPAYDEKINIALLCGTTGYMMAGLANDSSICVAPIFWVLMGIGYALNKKENKMN